MPLYEYQCTWCGKIFIAAVSIEKQEERNVACPGCGSRKVELLSSALTSETDRKS
jgi:putative FmdB family regulatory protein